MFPTEYERETIGGKEVAKERFITPLNYVITQKLFDVKVVKKTLVPNLNETQMEVETTQKDPEEDDEQSDDG
jgi:hypothetical protein